MKSEKEGINMRRTRTMRTGREDYAHWSKGLYSFSSPLGIDWQSVLLRPSKRNFASVKA